MRLLIILSILAYTSLWAKPQTILECLGKEEENIHREKLSMQAQLFNQGLISDLIGLKGLKVQRKFLNKICSQSSGLNSFRFLEVFLKNKGRIFEDRGTQIERRSNKALRNSFYEKILTRLNQYISINQMNSPTPSCLYGGDSAVSDFLMKMLYQRAFLSAYTVLHNKNLGLRVVKELKKFPERIKDCPVPEKK